MPTKSRLALSAGLVVLAVAISPAQQPQKPKLPEGTLTERDLAYGPHERNKLDIYAPKSDKPLPLIIWVHGGGWQNGSKEGGGQALRLLDQGYAVAAINYRLSSHATFPAQIEDCQAAVRWLRANAKKYNLDPDRFGAWGASAGGHLVALMGTAGDAKEFAGYGSVTDGSSRVQAVCDYYGPADFVRWADQPGAKSGVDADSPTSPVGKLLGGPVKENKETAAKASPVTFASKDDPPFLILHGDADTTVPLRQSELLHEALTRAGVDSTLIVVPKVGHSAQVGAGDNAAKIVAFFDKHLKAKK